MSWTDTIFKFLGRARYNTITPNLANGDSCEAQCDANGRLLVNTGALNTLWSDGGISAAERSIKSAPGRLYQVFGRNVGGSDRYLFFYNATARPSNGSTAHIFTPIKIAAGESFTLYLDRPRSFSVGLYWVISSSDGTLTFDAAATFQISAEYD